jgi:methyl acetate hydrolase
VSARLSLCFSSNELDSLWYTFRSQALLRLRNTSPEADLRNLFETADRSCIGPLVAQPDTAWHYSAGLAAAGFAIEAVTKEMLDQYLQDVICRPLGLTQTTFGDAPAGTPEKIDQRATMSDATTEWIRTTKRLMPLKKSCGGTGTQLSTSAPFFPTTAGGESLWSTADEMAILLATLLDAGKPILNDPSTVDLLFEDMLTPATRPSFAQGNPDARKGRTGFGLGYQISLEDDPETGRPAGTGGWYGLSGPYCWVDRKNGIVGSVCLLCLHESL